MNKKIFKLKQKGFINIISFFIEFISLYSVFSSAFRNGVLYNFLLKIFPFITSDIVLASSLSLIVLTTVLRTYYASYINNKIDYLESQMIEKQNDETKNDYNMMDMKDKIDKNVIFPKDKENDIILNDAKNDIINELYEKDNIYSNNEDYDNKKLVKVYKK